MRWMLVSIYKCLAWSWGTRAAEPSPWRDRVLIGSIVASYSALLGSAVFISLLSSSNPVLRLGVFGRAGLSSCCSKSLILLFVTTSDLDPFLGTFWTHPRFLFVSKRISGAHLVPLRAPTETSFSSFAALWHPPGITAGPPFTLCSFLGPVCWPDGTNLLAFDMASLPTLGCLQSWFRA